MKSFLKFFLSPLYLWVLFLLPPSHLWILFEVIFVVGSKTLFSIDHCVIKGKQHGVTILQDNRSFQIQLEFGIFKIETAVLPIPEPYESGEIITESKSMFHILNIGNIFGKFYQLKQSQHLLTRASVWQHFLSSDGSLPCTHCFQLQVLAVHPVFSRNFFFFSFCKFL